jgi:hypothetical protein
MNYALARLMRNQIALCLVDPCSCGAVLQGLNHEFDELAKNADEVLTEWDRRNWRPVAGSGGAN